MRPHAEWHKNARSSDGFASYCKPCRKERGRTGHLKRAYGLSAAEWEAKAAAQGGACAVCGTVTVLHVDHDHETERVRGLLCLNCNQGLGKFKDSVAVLTSAASYLRQRSIVTEGPAEAALAKLLHLDLASRDPDPDAWLLRRRFRPQEFMPTSDIYVDLEPRHAVR